MQQFDGGRNGVGCRIILAAASRRDGETEPGTHQRAAREDRVPNRFDQTGRTAGESHSVYGSGQCPLDSCCGIHR